MEPNTETLPVMGCQLGVDQDLVDILSDFELDLLLPGQCWCKDCSAGSELAIATIDSAATSGPERESVPQEAIEYASLLRRRENDRRKSRRHYVKKKNKRLEMQAEVDQLSQQLHDLLRINVTSRTLTRMSRSEEDLYQLSLTKSELAAENKGLHAMLRRYGDRMENLRRCFQEESPLPLELGPSFDSPMKLTHRECREFCEKSAAIVADFNADIQRVTGTQICGWTKTTMEERGRFQFSIAKTIAESSAKVLAKKTWKLITDPSYFCKMFKNLDLRVSLIQVVDEDNLVFLQERTIVDENKNVTVQQAMLLMAQIQVGNSYLLLTRHIGSDLFTWVGLDQLEPRSNGCFASYCGIADSSYPPFHSWVTEIFLHCLQWEKAVTRPRFSLPQSD